MAKFRYYIVNMFDGRPSGTNDKSVADNYALCDDAFVIDTETNEWLDVSGNHSQINEAKE
jgi:hypothetical protein